MVVGDNQSNGPGNHIEERKSDSQRILREKDEKKFRDIKETPFKMLESATFIDMIYLSLFPFTAPQLLHTIFDNLREHDGSRHVGVVIVGVLVCSVQARAVSGPQDARSQGRRPEEVLAAQVQVGREDQSEGRLRQLGRLRTLPQVRLFTKTGKHSGLNSCIVRKATGDSKEICYCR